MKSKIPNHIIQKKTCKGIKKQIKFYKTICLYYNICYHTQICFFITVESFNETWYYIKL